MTQNFVAPWVFYDADGSDTTFPYPFRIGAAADLKVYDNGTLVTAYTVTGVGAANGGNVVFTVAPTTGHTLLILRRGVQAQLVDYIANDPFGAETHEAILDQIVRMIQDLDERLSRVPTLEQMTTTVLRNLTFPAPGHGRAIGWNTAGTALTTLLPIASYTFNQGAGSRISFADFLDPGDDMGTVDVSAKLQTACELAIASKAALDIPPAAVGYRLDTPINLTDIDGWLTIIGAGQIAPAFNAALVPPVGGSLFLGNTGAGQAVFDCLGSNNILFQGINMSALGQSTPSTVGIVFGTSTTSPFLQTPAGANCSLENVSIWLPYNMGSVPLYFAGGAGLCHYTNLWTLGDHGIVISRDDDFAFTSQYATVGAAIGVDGMHFQGCNVLTYGTGTGLYIQGSHNMRFDQLYIATIFGGPSYSGYPYAIFLQDTTDIKIDIECDYYPSVLLTEGTIINVHVQGSTFPNVTPIPALVPLIAYFSHGGIRHVTIQVEPVMGAKPNFHFSSNGVTADLLGLNSCAFYFNTLVSNNIAFFNATNVSGKPFFNLRFDGTNDGGVYTFLINGAVAGAGTMRYWENGVLVGTG